MSMKFKPQLTPKWRKRLKDWGIKSAVFALCVAIIGFIYWPKGSDNTESTTSAFNTTMPEANVNNINGANYQQSQKKEKEQEVQYMSTPKQEQELQDTSKIVEKQVVETPKSRAASAENAYKDANKTAANFYSRPKVDHEKIRMQAQIEELKAQVREQEQKPPVDNTIDDQLAIIERSYELAAKYSAKPEPLPEQYKKGKAQINSMSQVSGGVVSSLTPTPDATFSTAVGGIEFNDKNTIAACIETTQTIVNNGAVKFRLLEPMMVGRYELPQGTTITGQSRVSGERLNVTISQIEYRGRIIPVELQIIDTDGIAGIFIPNSAEVSAIKQIVAGMGSDTESSLSLSTQSAGAELLTDLGKSAISGVADYVGEKIKEVKVHLKAGYRVMLYQGE